MFKIIFTLLFFLNLISQNTLEGFLKNKDGERINNARVIVLGTKLHALTDREGYFRFTKLKKTEYTIVLEHIAYEKKSTLLQTNTNNDIFLDDRSYISSEVSVSALRLNENAPLSFTNVSKKEIEANNFGQDLPYILANTPSFVESSDAGAGLGYTSFKIRGTDISRINITIDGIPLNEGESHGVWWVDLPDLASSLESVQIQRGVGSSTYGTGSFGAAVNIKTNDISNEFKSSANVGFGSYNTNKQSIRINSGMLNDNFNLDLRYSKIKSDGYIDRASSDLNSFYSMLSFIDEKNLIRFNYIHGKEKTYQAWNGVPKEKLGTDRTFNSYNYENETDNYTQDHYRLHFHRMFSNKLSANLSFHLTHGEGYYEQYKAGKSLSSYGLDSLQFNSQWYKNLDIIQQRWLDNDFWGFVSSMDYQLESGKTSLGISVNRYFGDHFGDIIRYQKRNAQNNLFINEESSYRWYESYGDKREFSAFAKLDLTIESVIHTYLDFQYRKVNYEISGIDNDLRDISQVHDYSFFNPKLGLSYDLFEGAQTYASFSVANREPARSDLTDANAVVKLKAERLFDYELGLRYQSEQTSVMLNAYYMDYKDQLVLSGAINDVGSPIKVNVPESFRAGIELSVKSQLNSLFSIEYHGAFSQNKIRNLKEYVDDWDNEGQQKTFFYKNTDISLSPNTIQSFQIDYKPAENLLFSLNSKSVSEQFIDNSSSQDRKLDAYNVINLQAHYRYEMNHFIKYVEFKIKVNNMFYEKYESNAWVYSYFESNERKSLFGFFPQAPRNFLIDLSIHL
jgi:iron complex outermembrane recepter protein